MSGDEVELYAKFLGFRRLQPVTEIADDLLNLPDRSFTVEAAAGELDDQSQVKLAYCALESTARIFSRTFLAENELGMKMFLKSISAVPFSTGLIVATYAMLIAMFLGNTTHLLENIRAGWLSGIIWVLCTTAFIFSRVCAFRKTVHLLDCIEPDHIVVSPQGIALQWSSKFITLPSYVIAWDELASSYLEKRKIGGIVQTLLCLRDKKGRTLVLDPAAFDSRFLTAALKRRAPRTIEDAPLSLVLQGVKKQPIVALGLKLAQLKTSKTNFPDPPGKAPAVRNGNELKPGDRLKNGRYSIIRKLAVDDMGTSYRAEVSAPESPLQSTQFTRVSALLGESERAWPSTSLREVRIQRLNLSKLSRRQRRRRLVEIERAFQALGQITCGQFAHWLEIFQDRGETYVVFETANGVNLKEYVAANGPLSQIEVLEVALSVGAILLGFTAASPAILHGQLSPQSIIRTEGGAYLLEYVPLHSLISTAGRTEQALNRRYSSLEQWQGLADFRGDIYSLARIMHFLVTAVEPEPFAQCRPSAIEWQATTPKNIHPLLDDLIAKATSDFVFDRHGSVEEFLDEAREAMRPLKGFHRSAANSNCS